MSTDVIDPVADVEGQRLRLEETIKGLRKDLEHWQTWEVEYEAFKEEISALGTSATKDDMLEVGIELGGNILNEKAIRSLLEYDGKRSRSKAQVLDLISKRIEYVARNVESLRKQVRVAEEKLASHSVVEESTAEDEDGLPIMEIQEELDENGNVTSSKTSIARNEASSILNMLEKAGVSERKERTADPKPPIQSRDNGIESKSVTQKSIKTTNSSIGLQSDDSNDTSSLRRRIKPEDRVQELNEDAAGSELSYLRTEEDGKSTVPPNLPKDESSEDAALRREMLEYGMSDVGAVVAELNLEDEYGSQVSYSDENVDDDDADGCGETQSFASSDTDEAEDEYGRTTQQVVTDDYRREMEALQQRLMQETRPGQKPKNEPKPLRVQRKPLSDLAKPADARSEKPAKKGVRFADDLDISESKEDVTKKTGLEEISDEPPMKDSIIERNSSNVATTASKPQKMSKFKQKRDASREMEPEATPAPLVSGAIVERPRAADKSQTRPPAPEPNQDPSLHRKEVASEFYQRRNHMIQKERGGFVQNEYAEREAAEREMEENEGRIPLDEEEEPPKMSMFRRARLNQTGGA